VERNRLRRRLLELLRTGWLEAERDRAAPRDLLVRAGAAAYDRSFAELSADLQDGLERVS
jgi:RNase P protein component